MSVGYPMVTARGPGQLRRSDAPTTTATKDVPTAVVLVHLEDCQASRCRYPDRGSIGRDCTGVGAVAATVLLAWSHPGRIRSEAAFAALAGASPLSASSGNTSRYRLNRGGGRRLNRALYTVALVRMGHDSRTRDYVTRRIHEGRTKREIMRNLKRYISRQLFRTLNSSHPATSAT